jgi:diguanylate cyclase (GGDEF)-like protein
VFNNSRDRLDLATSWGCGGTDREAGPQPDHITPASCWALKRGKPHRNAAGIGALRCAHAVPGVVSLEIPMAARGEVYGLLELEAEGEDAEARLLDIQQIAGALADAMSLALSSISLRERLRNQALRDPLTGLYNRRFLEEMLERLTLEAERRRSPLAVMMIDLDHFKLLNDQFGHATGDAVLRQTATIITTSLRATDVACRYGGEELAILMPDCGVESALAKAELIRLSITAMSKDGRLPHVSASFGIACTPETTARAEDLLPAADAALYVAKQQGRDRVVAAALRGQPPKLALAE